MRFLNKVVFINSATIRYADVLADGNVHLIGTQGVGKSTLLRAVLYFYNADSLKLGISREKKSFAEYYFPFQNSYLVYEVVRETGPYCVLAFKSQGKICFRFIDTAYDKKFFISEDGHAFEKWENTRKLLDDEKIDYTRKIDRYEEYRDIVYGNNEGGKKEFGKYALLQSRQYQNIPRTIQNVFLNSKLEAEFIKQTIIMSLNEDDISVDLQNYTHHLRSFEEQLADVSKYKTPAVQKLADNVVKLHLDIRHLEKDKNTSCRQLVWAFQQTQKNLPRLEEKITKTESDKQTIEGKISSSETRFRNKAHKINGEISVLDNDLKKAKEKTDYYAAKNIDAAIKKVQEKESVETSLKQLAQEKNLLTATYSDINNKYALLNSELENKKASHDQQQQKRELERKEQAMHEKDASRKWRDKAQAEIRNNQKQSIAQAREALEQQSTVLQQSIVKRESIRHTVFLKEEIQAAKDTLFEKKLELQQAIQLYRDFESRKEHIENKVQLEETRIRQDLQRRFEKCQEGMNLEENLIAEIQSKLQNSEQALYGWLNTHHSGWENTIGKVCSETILFNNQLSPRKTTGSGVSLYGIELNLDGIPIPVKTLAEYEREKQQSEQRLSALKKEIDTLHASQDEQLEKLKKKYTPQVKECREGISEQQYRQEQDTAAIQRTEWLLKDLEIKAAAEKQLAIESAEQQVNQEEELLLQRKQELQSTENEEEKLLKAREREYDKKLSAIDQQLNTDLSGIRVLGEKGRKDYEDEGSLLEERRMKELKGKGADTNRIREVEDRLNKLQLQLREIETLRDLVAEYKKDKRELFDKTDEYRTRKQLLDQQYQQEDAKHRLQLQGLRNEISQLDEQLQQTRDKHRQTLEDEKAFRQFQSTEAFLNTEDAYKEVKELYKTDKRCKELIDEFNRSYYAGIRRLDDLKETVNNFLGNFSKQNIFNFTTSLHHKQEYLEFAEHLGDFVNNAKIDEFEKRINERFANIIHSLSKETQMLMSKGGEILAVINNINRDFDNKNFVGAIKKIELRLDESANKVVQLLLVIKKFNDENSFDIGGLNLFSGNDQESKNKKAVDLLMQLAKAIAESKKDTVALSDSFELKFRVEENQNDTGWVEKLSNVGSEGTDVLVKAMINIMLLNVFKEGASKRFKDFRLHCMMDEIGKLHPNNVKGILQFANDRNILLINGSPTETNALDYRHIYKLEKDAGRYTKIKRIITNYTTA